VSSSSEAPAPPNYITTQGYTRLRLELQSLVLKERPEVTQIVSWAASNGDRSENGDYLYGKKRLREIDRRIRFLTKRLEKAQVVDPSVPIYVMTRPRKPCASWVLMRSTPRSAM
jgi:transcription elongation factor GreB